MAAREAPSASRGRIHDNRNKRNHIERYIASMEAQIK
jgi:hypothetical protein